MPNPVREDILAAIETQIAAITTGNGFDNTISNVQRWRGNGNTLKTVPAVIIKAGPETRSVKGQQLTDCYLDLELILFTRVEEANTSPTDTILNSLLGDIEKKIMADQSIGGKAVEIDITEVLPFDSVEGQPDCGLIITARINYRTQTGDPKTAR